MGRGAGGVGRRVAWNESVQEVKEEQTCLERIGALECVVD